MREGLSSWEHPEWYARASAWVEGQLASVGREVLAPLEQVRWWSLSRVLRVRASGGNVYFKASTKQPLFASEGILLTYLMNVSPDRVPKVISTEPAFRWMLLEDAGPVLSEIASPETKTAILTTFAALQYASVEHVDQLLASCCVDRRVQTLIPEIDPLMNDELVTSKLRAHEIGELRSRVPDIIEMCSYLSEHAVPPTLIHGDLHSGNVIFKNGQLVVIDWAEACIAHPFMDAFMIFNEEDDAVRNRMRDVYLQMWTDFESIERLRELWSICSVVHSIHHALSYLTILHNTTEARRKGELEGTLPFLLRKTLRYLHEPA